VRIVTDVTGISRRQARGLLRKAGGSSKVAILMHARKLNRGEAVKRLKACGASLRRATEKE